MGLKLLYITNGINGSGGLERVLSVKASLLAEEFGYEVGILCLNEGHLNPFYTFSSKIKTSSIAVSGNPISYFSTYKKGIQKAVNDFNPDVISVCDDGLKGFFLPRIIRTKAKWIYERHVSKLIEATTEDPFLKTMAVKIKWKLMAQLGKKFDKFVVLTKGNQKEWPSLRNMTVIPNPLSFMPEEYAELNNKVVICVGKISYQKGQDLLVKAWEIVHQKHPDWQLHLFGKENLDFLDTNNLKNNIHFFPPEKNIQQKYIDSSIYVMSSRFEGFGMVLIEAMACGVPCVSFDCNYGPGDIISDNEDGFLVRNENVKELADRIIYLIENEAIRKSFGMQARMNSRKFTASKIVQNWNQLFKELRK